MLLVWKPESVCPGIDFSGRLMYLRRASKSQLSDLVVLDIADRHQGIFEHGRKIIDSCASVQDRFQVRVAVKFQFRDLDSVIHRSARGAAAGNSYIRRLLHCGGSRNPRRGTFNLHNVPEVFGTAIFSTQDAATPLRLLRWTCESFPGRSREE